MFQELCTFYKSLKPHQAEEVEQALAICQDLDDDTLVAVRTLAMATGSASQEEIKKAIDAVNSPRWPSISERQEP
jgi:hypothetical protein